MSVEAGRVKAVPRLITRVHLDTLYKFGRHSEPGYAMSGIGKPGELVIHALPLKSLVEMYDHFTAPQLRDLASLSQPTRLRHKTNRVKAY